MGLSLEWTDGCNIEAFRLGTVSGFGISRCPSSSDSDLSGLTGEAIPIAGCCSGSLTVVVGAVMFTQGGPSGFGLLNNCL